MAEGYVASFDTIGNVHVTSAARVSASFMRRVQIRLARA